MDDSLSEDSSDEEDERELVKKLKPDGNYCLFLPVFVHPLVAEHRLLETIREGGFTSVCAANGAVSTDNSFAILTALAEDPGITSMSFPGCGFSNQALEVLMNSESALQRLTLDLNMAEITAEGYDIIFRSLATSSSLTHLVISGAGDSRITKEAILRNRSVREFHYVVDDAHSNENFAVTMNILRAVMDNAGIGNLLISSKKWDFPGNVQQQEQMIHLLGKMVQNNSTLCRICLDGYFFSLAEKEKLLDVMLLNPRLHPVVFSSQFREVMHINGGYFIVDPMRLRPMMTNKQHIVELKEVWRSLLLVFAMSDHPRLGSRSIPHLGGDVMQTIMTFFYLA
jgi:hypothetical protein